MRLSTTSVALFATMTLAAPAIAQELAISVFTTVATENVPRFEDAARAHSEWHGQQNDTQAWPVYQAFTGRSAEYVFVAPNMTWASMDNPSLDMADDQAHWTQTAAQHVESEDIQLWTQMTAASNPLPDEMGADYPVVRVVEFEILPGGDGAFLNAIRMFKDAMDAQAPDLYFAWNRVVSADQPPGAFIAVWAPSFEELGAPSPSPLTRMGEQFGVEAAGAASEAFNRSVRTTADRVWLFRPDLSYMPGM